MISNFIESHISEYVEKGGCLTTCSHLFISFIAFSKLVKEYGLPQGLYKVDESDNGFREMVYQTAHGALKIVPVHEHADFIMIGRDDTYAQYNLENVIWGEE
jgi:hypothetical protein